MAAQKRPDPPEGWWVRLARPLVRDYQHGFVTLSKHLAKKSGRQRPWNHAALSRFVANGQCSVDLAAAISKYFNLPRPAFIARSVGEAWALEAVAAKYKDLTSEQAERDLQAEIISIQERSADRARAAQAEAIREQIEELQQRLAEAEQAKQPRPRRRRHAS